MKFLAIFLTGLCGLCSALAAELVIFSTADLHGSGDNLAGAAAVFAAEPDAVKIDCGDLLQGGYAASINHGSTMIELLNCFKFDVWVPGNHDFDFGADALRKRIGEFQGATLGGDWRHRDFAPARWVMLRRAGRNIAVIGLGEPNMAERLIPESQFEFKPCREAAREILREVLKQKPDLIVLAWHSGIYSMPGSLYSFIADFPEIDLVLTAHSHQEIPGKKFSGAWLVQPGARGHKVAKISVDFPPDSKPAIRSELIATGDMPPADRRLAEILAKDNLPAENFQLAEPFTTPAPGESDTPFLRFGAQAMLAAVPEADAALFFCPTSKTARHYRDNLSARALFYLLPYENCLCTVRISHTRWREVGAQLRRIAAKRRWSYSALTRKSDTLFETGELTVAIPDFYLNELFPEQVERGEFKLTPVALREAVSAALRSTAR